ncbi:hypothetical protein [Micromonospora sagamiensis]|uniref:hypothetical protein n=1 Tax=Micromonospora sagamiensis TaxID=47875 RepID=UPI00119FAF72|nr:hypothetical protein [Micromonospora sagamiensis]
MQSSHELTFLPSHQLLILRDIDSYADPGASVAISTASRQIASASGYGVYINTVQDLVAVHSIVEVWSSPPSVVEGRPGWTPVLTCVLDSPTGQFLLADTTGSGFAGIDPSEGPGRYGVNVFHQGREQAKVAFQTILDAMDQDAWQQPVNELQQQNAGVEKYLVQLWWQKPLDPDGQDDETDAPGAG